MTVIFAVIDIDNMDIVLVFAVRGETESDSNQTFIAMTKPAEGTVFERCGMNKDIPVICSTDVM